MREIHTRPEPVTKEQIRDEIAFLEEYIKGSSKYLRYWLSIRIKELKEKLNEIK